MNRARRRRDFAGLTLALAFAAGPALGGEPDTLDQARAYFNVGARAFAARQYSDAIQAFEHAYDLTPRDGLLFSLAQAHKKKFYVEKQPNDLRAAIKYYREYLGRVKQGGRSAEAMDALVELEPRAAGLEAQPATPTPAPKERLTELMVASPSSSVRIELDGHDAGKLPFVSEVAPGKHHVRLTAPGYEDYARDISILAGSVVPLDVPLVEKPAMLNVSAPSGAHVSVDGKEIGVAPLLPVKLASGRHFVAVTMNGRQPFVRDMTLTRGKSSELTAQLPVTAQRTASWVLFGTSATAFVSSGILALTAYRKQSDAQKILDRRTSQNISASELDSYSTLRGQRDDYRTASIVAATVGGVLATTGAVLFVFDEPRPPRPRPTEQRPGAPTAPAPGMELAARPFWAPGAAGAAVSGRF